MANILLLDDEKSITSEFASYITDMGHKGFECQSSGDVLDTLEKMSDNNEQINLFVLDHDLGGGETSLKLLRILDKQEYSEYQNRFIVATGHASTDITQDYAKFGSMGHLIKPIHQNQFTQTITHALSRIDYLNNQEENWQSAYQLLEDMNLLDSMDELKKNNIEVNDQYLALKDIYDQLIADVKDKQGEDVVKAYESASNAVNRIKGGFEIIHDFADDMKFTPKFIDDVEYIYNKERILFFRLMNYLGRINDSPDEYRIKKLNGAGNNAYEYRVGRDYRLYFSRQEEGNIQLERFGHKNIQDNIIHNLAQS